MADAVDELYPLPPGEFTAARNELATRLRKAGERAGADAVKRLAKPTLSAWALNQVAHRKPAVIQQLLAAGGDLARAQQHLLAGYGQAEFREASRTEKAAVAATVQAAAAVLGESSGQLPGKAMLDRLEATARAATTDPNAGDILRAGRLTTDLDPTSFGDLAGFGSAAAPIPFPKRPVPEPRETTPPPSPRAPSDRQKRMAGAREEVSRLQRALKALREEAGEAEGEAARTRQAAGRADRAWTEARQAAAKAEQATAAARKAQDDAAETLAAIRVRLDQAADQLAAAEAELRELRG